jgi:ComF family protein
MEISSRRWTKHARAFLDGALATFWPPTCVLCGCGGRSPALDLCAECEADLIGNEPSCSICAEPLMAATTAQCGACIKRKPRFDRAICAFRYGYPLDHLIRGLKYRNAVSYARVLGDLLAMRIQHQHERLPELIIPVPLATGRFRERGFNQALELGRQLEKQLRLPMRTDVIVRTRETPEQAGLDQKRRRKNIRGAFQVVGTLAARHIALVDDVVTTGSTANEVAKVLKRAGARRVEVWAVARAAKQSLVT